MSVAAERKAKIVKEYQSGEKDTGSSAVQIALLTDRINSITEHMKIHRKDYHSRYGLQLLVSQRNRLLKYVFSRSHKDYRDLVDKLGIRGKLDRAH